MRHVVPSVQPPLPLRDYLPLALPGLPSWALRQMLAERQIKRDGVRMAAGDAVRGGDVLTLYLPKAALSAAEGESAPLPAPPIPTVYEDARIWLVNKPQGIATQQADDPQDAPGVLELLRHALAARGEPADMLRPCHRLDHHTGGLLLFAKDEQAEAILREAFARHAVEKLYTCLCVGTPEPEQRLLHAYLRKDAQAASVTVRAKPFPGALPIETAYRVLAPGDIARLEVRLITGRTHQIRAHLAFIGHPVLGDDKYGDRAANRLHGARRQMLWATGLALRPSGALAYLDGHAFSVEAPF